MRKLFGKALLSFLTIISLVGFTNFHAFAQDQAKSVATSPTATEEEAQTQAPVKEVRYYYERPTREKFSRLYWVMNMLDINDDKAVDNFLMINECDIYKDYYFNEFEWKKVRESGRQFLAENKNNFPIRFEIVQPLFLGEYDTATKSFNVIPEYQIKETTRMEILPNDYNDKPCMDDGSGHVPIIPGYPAGVIAEFNRPLNVTKIPVPPELAKYYIEEKLKNFKKLDATRQTQDNLYKMRDAYIFMHIKFFSNKGTLTQYDSYVLTDMMAIIEGMEVYSDRDKKVLLWKQDFRKKKQARIKSEKNEQSIEEKEPPTEQNTGANSPSPESVAAPAKLQ